MNDSMKFGYSQKYRFFLFLLLLAMTLTKPSSFLPIPVLPMVPITLLLMLLITVVMFVKSPSIMSYYLRFKVEFGLFIGYITLCIISLGINLDRYETMAEVIHYGVVPIAVSFSAVLFFILFKPLSVGTNSNGNLMYFSLSCLVFVLLSVIGIWQFFDYESSKTITRFFVSSELPDETDFFNVRSLFRVSTDFGPMLAVLCIVLLSLTKQQLYNKYRVMILLALVPLFFAAGLMSGSRNFVSTFTLGLLVVSASLIKRNLKLFIVCGLVVIAVVNASILSSERLRFSYGKYFPYIEKVHARATLEIGDFVPQLDGNSSLSGRIDLWVRAIEEVSNSPLFGVSNGAYKLSDTSFSTVNNTHNLVLQVLVDAGILGLILVCLLLYRINGHLTEAGKPVFWAVIASLMFDYYLDHSLPWLVCISWMLSNMVYSRLVFTSNTTSD